MAAVEPILALDDIQGNIVPGFLKDHEVLLFFRIEDAAAAKRWLRSLAPRVSSAAEVRLGKKLFEALRKRQGGDPAGFTLTWLNLAISAAGLRLLTSETEVSAFEDPAFRIGMADRSAFLSDPTDPASPGHPSRWLVGGSPGRRVDLVLILAGDHGPFVDAEAEALAAAAAAEGGLALVHRDRGRVRPDRPGHEHFGFKDGVSQPELRGRVSEAPDDFLSPRAIPRGDPRLAEYAALFSRPGRPLVWPGHFLFGYDRQREDDPAEPSDEQPRGPAWARNGSFLVFRRLTQDVAGFWRFAAAEAARLRVAHPALATMTDRRLAALLVGRWPSGAPVMRSPDEDDPALAANDDAANYFQYFNTVPAPLPGDPFPLNPPDPGGALCPVAAHIRKVNPRDMPTDLGSDDRTFRRLILRRGLPFGDPLPDPAAPPPGDGERGLLFLCYQSSISNQFEFLMTDWANRPDRPTPGGHDPVIGQPTRRPPGQRTVTLRLPGGERIDIALPAQWVIPSGGEYFFAPPLSFLTTVLQDP